MKYTAPNDVGLRCRYVAIDEAVLPIVRGKLLELLTPYVWATYGDYVAGYKAIAEVVHAMGCNADLTGSIDRLYRLLDAALNGTVYTAAGDGTVLPALPDVPATPAGVSGGLRLQLLEAQGELPGGWLGLGARPATTADLVRAVRAGESEELDTMLDKIDLLGDASDITGIYNAVKGTATDLAGLAEGGGTLATLVVSTLAQAAAAGLLQGSIDTLVSQQAALLEKIDRLIASTDGGSELRPDGNLLSVAEATRSLLSPDEAS